MGRFQVWSLCDVALPLTLAGLFGALMPPSWGVAASLCSNAGFALAQVFMTVAMCNVSFRYGVSALMLLGWSSAANQAAGMLGGWLARSLPAWPAAAGTAAVGSAAVILAVCLSAVSGSRGRDVTWGVGFDGESEGGAGRGGAESLEARCAMLARERGLTRREEEVLGRLALDLPASEIAEALCVSTPTVKTHTQGVYRKLGVHSRAELAQRVEEAGR